MSGRIRQRAAAQLHKMGITGLLVAMIAGLVALTLTACTVLFVQSYRTLNEQNASTSAAQAVSQLARNIGSYVLRMDEDMGLITTAMMKNEAERDTYMQALLSVQTDMIAVTTYEEDGAMVGCWAAGHTPKTEIFRNLSFDQTAVQAGARTLSTPHVVSIFEGYYPWVVTLTEQYTINGKTRYTALDFSFNAMAASINGVGVGQHGYCFVMDSDGNMVYHPQQQLLYADLKTEETDRLAALADGTYVEDTVIYSLQSVPGSSWRVVGVSFIDELVNQNVTRMSQYTALIALAVLAVILVLAWVISRVLTRPLRQLETAMEQFEQDADHFSYTPPTGTREVQELAGSFGHMVLRIQELMKTVREEEINLRKTELKALQAQINPHFLYNTLDSIAWMCERGKNADAVQMVHALARLFRISISRGHELIPIAKEIEHAESYLQIQKYRYKNQFTYHFTVDEGCTKYLCNKITLQPIIENAITHGLDLLVDPGHIEVVVRPGGQDGEDIVFEVIDNGVGMAPELVETMLQRGPSDRTGIGIKNVNDRLRIYFGEGYGLTIESVPDEGTTVKIRMPKIEEGQYDAIR